MKILKLKSKLYRHTVYAFFNGETKMRKQSVGYMSLGIIGIILLISSIYALALAEQQGQQGQAGTTLTASVTATGYWRRTYAWTIEKTVTPDTWNLFVGDSGRSRFTITVTKDGGTDKYGVEGNVTVTNGGDSTTENLKIVVQVEYQTGAGPFQPLPGAVQTIIPVKQLEPGETGIYEYSIEFTPIPGAKGYRVSAKVTITNHSGHLGEEFGPEPKSGFSLPGSPTLVNDVIHVYDTNGYTWEFGGSSSVTYEKKFTCYDKGENVNTATIEETGQSASATVTVNCYELKVTKDASTSFKRTYQWTIDKKGDKTSLELGIGETSTVNYEITVNATYTDSEWAVSGTITVYNPAPIPVTINSITDVVSPDIEATVNFAVTFPYELAAGGTLTGKYSAILPDNSSRVNTVTVNIQNYDYDYQLNPTSSGTTDFSVTAEVDFSSATITEVDECIGVSDTYAGSLGTVTYEDAPKTFTYSRVIGPYGEPGEYTVENTASFVACDTGATGSDSWTVTVTVSSKVEYCYETAYGKGDYAICFIPTFSNWGWTNPLPGYGKYTFELWAGAGQCDTSKGTLVGKVTVEYGEGNLDVTFNLNPGVILVESHVYAGSGMFPTIKVGKKTVQTVAPGQYYIDYHALGGDGIYVIVHAVVGIPCTS